MSQDTELERLQAAALSAPEQKQIEALRSKIVGAKLSGADYAAADAERAELCRRRDAELTAYKARARAEAKSEREHAAANAAQELIGKSPAELDALNAQLLAESMELSNRMLAVTHARDAAERLAEFNAAKAKLSEAELAIARERGLVE